MKPGSMAQDFAKPLLCEYLHVRERRVGEGERGATRDCAGHVTNTIVNDAFLYIKWLGMGRWTRGFAQAALIDTDID